MRREASGQRANLSPAGAAAKERKIETDRAAVGARVQNKIRSTIRCRDERCSSGFSRRSSDNCKLRQWCRRFGRCGRRRFNASEVSATRCRLRITRWPRSLCALLCRYQVWLRALQAQFSHHLRSRQSLQRNRSHCFLRHSNCKPSHLRIQDRFQTPLHIQRGR